MPYWDHEGETQGIASPLCDSYNKGKMPGLSLRWTGLFSFMCPPLPQTVLKVPARVEKSVPHYRGDYEFSILTGGTFTFKTVSPRLSEKSRREQKSLYPTTGATTDSQSSLRVLLLLRQSPPPQVSARVFSMYSGRISGVCLQWCIQGASQVFACKGVFRAHLRCLQLTGTVIGPVSA